MSVTRSVLFLLFVSLPATASPGVVADDLPGGTVWYLHADLAQMRTTDSGLGLYRWLDGEVFVEINDEIGIDVNEEVDSITAFSGSTSGTVIIVDGSLKTTSQEYLLARAGEGADIDERKHKGKAYFYIKDRDGRKRSGRSAGVAKDLDDDGYISFALRNKFLITGNEAQMTELLDNKGKVAGSGSHSGALFVLTADKSFVQAGLDTQSFSDDDDDWDSNIIRNTEQAALMVSDFQGKIAIEAQLVSTEPSMAQSIGGIANGLLGLQAFNSDLDPEIRNLLAHTKIEVEGSVLTIATVIEPDLVLDVLEN